MAKIRTILYLDGATALALDAYRRRHQRGLPTLSAAGAHLLRRALLSEIDEGLEGLLIPVLERRVEDAADRAIAARLKAQTDRLAGLLVRAGQDAVAAGKDAATAGAVAALILEVVLGDAEQARRIVANARLRAGARYARRAIPDDGAERNAATAVAAG